MKRHVFICGLHRSGTTLLAKTLAAHPLTSGFEGTQEIEDEGQFLQSVLPLERMFGGVGRFGFDPRAHMTEQSSLNTAETAVRLNAEWGRHWRPDSLYRIEKTPSNLLRMRLLQALFEQSYFIIVTRHPIASCLATLKWTEGSIFSLFEHWLHCHRIARADAAYLERVIWLSYEAFVADPAQELNRLSQFLDLEGWSGPIPEVSDQNEAYFSKWRTLYLGDNVREIAQKAPERQRSLLTRLRDRVARDQLERAQPMHRKRRRLRDFYEAQDLVARYSGEIAQFGYSFDDAYRVESGLESSLIPTALEIDRCPCA